MQITLIYRCTEILGYVLVGSGASPPSYADGGGAAAAGNAGLL